MQVVRVRLRFSKKARFLIETVAFVTGAACALALLIATLGVVAAAAAGQQESGTRTYEGIITDTRCGAKHSATMGRTASDCTIACVREGEHFVLVDGDTTYLLDGDAMALKQVAGRRVRIAGALSGKTISVTSVIAA